MKLSIRYMLLFSATVIAGAYLHEIGHAVAGWVNGVAIVPTPANAPDDESRNQEE